MLNHAVRANTGVQGGCTFWHPKDPILGPITHRAVLLWDRQHSADGLWNHPCENTRLVTNKLFLVELPVCFKFKDTLRRCFLSD